MDLKNIKNLIFDFDGVIYPSQDYHVNKLNEVFNIGLTMEDYRDAGRGNTNILMRKKEKFKEVIWDTYHKEIEIDFPTLKVNDEVKKVLINFSEKYNLFIISSGHNKQIIDFLKNNNIYNLFSDCLFVEDHFLKTKKFKILEKRFDISSDNSIFITDTIGDIIEAREVGYKSIGITGGSHSREVLETENPICIVDNFLELKEVL